MSTLIPAWVNGHLKPVDKLRVHHEGLRHKAISVFVLCGDQMLLQRRALEKYHSPGLWANACCTHPHWRETASDCAIRRLDEELGLKQLDLSHACQLEYRARVGHDMIEHEVVDVFLHRCERPLSPRPNPTEVMETAWVPIRQVTERTARHPERYSAWLTIYMRDHAERIFGSDTASALVT